MMEIWNVMSNFTNAKYNDVGGVRDHIFNNVQIVMKLKEFKVLVTDDFLVTMFSTFQLWSLSMWKV